MFALLESIRKPYSITHLNLCMFLHYLGKFLIASSFVIRPQILIFLVFKIRACFLPYWLQIKFSMSLFFYLFTFAINLWHKPRGMQSTIFLCLSQARINWEGCGRKGIRCKNEGNDEGGSLTSSEGVAPSWTVGVSTSVIFPCTIKSKR